MTTPAKSTGIRVSAWTYLVDDAERKGEFGVQISVEVEGMYESDRASAMCDHLMRMVALHLATPGQNVIMSYEETPPWEKRADG